jgi:hypothetical protein
MRLLGGAAAARPVGLEALPGTANYFIGNDPSRWRTDVPTYAKVEFPDVYPGVDLVFHGRQRQLEYDFVVAPGVRCRRCRRVRGEGVPRPRPSRSVKQPVAIAVPDRALAVRER